MRSEHELYYEGCQRGMFAHEDAAECGCGGSGWFLSQVDTWHSCPVHYTGQEHPEANDGDAATLAPESRCEAEETTATAAALETHLVLKPSQP